AKEKIHINIVVIGHV
nr:RecName: Full=Elongation factor 1-alpha; Short=EF-1-alpha [Microplitis croceipes]